MKKQPRLRGEVGRLRWFFRRLEHAGHNAPFPWRASLLIFAAGPAVNAPALYTLLVWIGYLACAALDLMKKDQVLDEEISWERDPDDHSGRPGEPFARKASRGTPNHRDQGR